LRRRAITAMQAISAAAIIAAGTRPAINSAPTFAWG
jgi:hypothetical protein